MSDLDRIPDWMQPDTTSGQLDLKVWAQNFRDVYQVAEAICKTPFVPREMLNNPEMTATCIMKGRELGLDPLDSLGAFYVVHGRIGVYADFMRRRIIQFGHTLRIIESTDSRCVIEGIRKEGGEPHRASFTAEQARKAGIDLGKYPSDKLVARATSRLCKQAFPDVLSGTLIAEDLIDGLIPAADIDTTTTVPAGAKPALKRGRTTKPAKAAATQPAPAPKPDTTDELAELLGDQPTETSASPPDQNPDLPTRAPRQRRGHDPSTDTASRDLSEAATQTPDDDDDDVPPWERPPVQPSPNQIPLIPDKPDEPDDEIRLITAAQLTKLSILLREQGFDDRDARHDFVAEAIGRHIDTAKELTVDEASRVIDILENDRATTDDD